MDVMKRLEMIGVCSVMFWIYNLKQHYIRYERG
jgi:hypothetical protein